MKTIIAGSRGINDYSLVCKTIKDSNFDITEVVSGCARGVDQLGEQFAKENNIPIRQLPAKWDEHGKFAGAVRNREMAEQANALIALMLNNSKGTKNMIATAKRLGLKVFVREINEMSLDI